MVRTNVKIIEELKLFLDTVLEHPEIRGLFTTKPSDFSRERKLPLRKLIGFLINLPKRSLSVEIQSFFEVLDQGGASCTKGAFSLQRTKLKPDFFTVWNAFLVECFYTHYGTHVQHWKGFRLLAVDGSTFTVVNVPETLEHFGAANNQYRGVPMARVMQIHDVLNDITLWGGIFPKTRSENGIMADNVHCLPADSLTLFDRGFPSYALMYLMISQEEPRHFAIRCKAAYRKEVKSFMQSADSDVTTIMYPSVESIENLKKQGYIIPKDTGIAIRMVKIILPDGETEILLTNLYDQERFSIQEMGKLYFMRWKIETAYGKQKNQMQMEITSGHRVVCIEQDYAAGLFVANLQSVIEKQCQTQVKEISHRRQHGYQVNKNASWAALKDRILRIFVQQADSYTLLMELQHLFVKNIEPVRTGRQVPRVPENRKRGKYQTFTNYRRAI